jgi:hypothetical protein
VRATVNYEVRTVTDRLGRLVWSGFNEPFAVSTYVSCSGTCMVLSVRLVYDY